MTLTDMFTNKVELLSKAGGLSALLRTDANTSCSQGSTLSCAIFLRYLGRDDHHKNPNINDRDHLVGQLTILRVESP